MSLALLSVAHHNSHLAHWSSDRTCTRGTVKEITISKMALNRLKDIRGFLNLARTFHSVEQGSKFSTTYRKYLKLDNGEVGSFFHDVPLNLEVPDNTVNMVVEVPRWSNAKFEISKELEFNPIVQDTKKGKVRFIHNIFPYHGYIHNYGALSQTWEDPSRTSVDDLKGDNDPLDCCEIGSTILGTGTVLKVKILGSLALIDDGELDWKIIAINVNDPLAEEIKDLDDVERKMPGILHATREWFRNYKVPAGKPVNKFAFNESYRNTEDTIRTIRECNAAWQTLVNETHLGPVSSLPQIARAGKGVVVNQDLKPPHEVPSEVEHWSYL